METRGNRKNPFSWSSSHPIIGEKQTDHDNLDDPEDPDDPDNFDNKKIADHQRHSIELGQINTFCYEDHKKRSLLLV